MTVGLLDSVMMPDETATVGPLESVTVPDEMATTEAAPVAVLNCTVRTCVALGVPAAVKTVPPETATVPLVSDVIVPPVMLDTATVKTLEGATVTTLDGMTVGLLDSVIVPDDTATTEPAALAVLN